MRYRLGRLGGGGRLNKMGFLLPLPLHRISWVQPGGMRVGIHQAATAAPDIPSGGGAVLRGGEKAAGWAKWLGLADPRRNTMTSRGYMWDPEAGERLRLDPKTPPHRPGGIKRCRPSERPWTRWSTEPHSRYLEAHRL